MSKLVVLTFGKGNLNDGFPVTLEIGEENVRSPIKIIGNLPRAPELIEAYYNWRAYYRRLKWTYRNLKYKEDQVKNVSLIQDCATNAQTLITSLNVWLDSVEFLRIKERLLKKLQPSEEIRIQIQTRDIQLRQLPWHLWNLILDDYPKAEITFSIPESEEIVISTPETQKKRVKILALLGDNTNLQIEKDLEILQKQLPDAYILPLFQPNLKDLNDKLWEQEWDILFFAGHSTGATIEGRIYINQNESITIEDLKFALKKAIYHRLKLAIFNSCDGLKLAQKLEDLQMSASIVMREQIPDEAAQKFLAYFLKPFAEEGKSLYISVREAREQLHGLKNQYPYASWLPVICEYPTAPTLTWQNLGGLLPCPYRGLFAFQEKDHSVFFGREAFTNQLLEAVKQKPLVVVLETFWEWQVFCGICRFASLSTP